jgi:phosphopantetheine adenylyltransferase
MKTIEDYQKRFNHLKNYCEKMILKNSEDTKIRNAYTDVLFKITYER